MKIFKVNYILHFFILVFICNFSFSVNSLESQWGTSEASKVRLISPLTHINNEKQLIIGLEYQMDPGWKTYWQSPGDAGFPQEISWSNSTNIKNISLSWPVPKEFEILNMKSIGYENKVIFPLKVELFDFNKEALINLSISYLVCKDICLPGNANLNLIIPSGNAKPTSHFYEIEKTLSLLPIEDISLTSFYNFNIDVSTDKEKTLIFFKANTKSVFENPKIYLHTPFGLPVVDPILEYTYDYKTLKAYYYFDKELISLNSFNLSFVLINSDQSLLIESVESNELLNKIPKSKNTFIYFIFVALIGGLVLNIMPCVFPVLSIKLLTVLESQNKSIRISFLVSALGIISSFIILSIIFFVMQNLNINISWGMQFQQPYFLLIISFILSVFMLNIFGIFEFQTPQFSNISNHKLLNKNSFLKDYFNGFFATLLATPCSAPFVGTAITAAFTQTTFLMFSIFIAMGIGMSIPYLIVSLFPSFISFLPKPGKWMLYTKYFLGLLLIITLVWISNILLNYFNYYFILFSILLLLLSIVLLKKYKNKIIIGIILLSIFLTIPNFSFFNQKVFNNSNNNWKNFFKTDIEKLIENDQILFLDITADWCATCQFNKINVLNNDKVLEIFKKNNIVKVRADWTKPNSEIDKFLHKHNRFGIPFNAFFSKKYPNGIILSEFLTEKGILNTLENIK